MFGVDYVVVVAHSLLTAEFQDIFQLFGEVDVHLSPFFNENGFFWFRGYVSYNGKECAKLHST